MLIEHLDWDSNFFGYPVGKICVADENELSIGAIEADAHKLLYLFSDAKLPVDTVNGLRAVMVDEKTELIKALADRSASTPKNAQVVSISNINNAVINLALQSGIYSRFNIDKSFRNNEFEKLYTAWIIKSVNRQNANEVYGFVVNNNITGLLTIGIRNNKPDIGLIAVDKAERGKNIGTALLCCAMQYSLENGHDKLSVITQGANVNAINFYKKNGFITASTVFIYHIWK